MGEVYRVRNLVNGRDYALKVIRPEFAQDPDVIELFRREARALEKIRNEVIVGYGGLQRDEFNRPYIVMEYVEGPSLADLMGETRFTVDQVRTLRDKIAEALDAAHQMKIVHRDISPDNIVLQDGDWSRPRLIDFGIARDANRTATVIGKGFAGKFTYASPEQLGDHKGVVDGRSDIYSLGLVLAALMRGVPLDMGSNHVEYVEARRRIPDLDGVPEEFQAELRVMLQPDPDDRPARARDLVGYGASLKNLDLNDGGGGQQPLTHDLSVSDRSPRRGDKDRGSSMPEPGRGRRGLFVLLVVLLLIGAGLAVYLGRFGSMREEKSVADVEVGSPSIDPGPSEAQSGQGEGKVAEQKPVVPSLPERTETQTAVTLPPAGSVVAKEPTGPSTEEKAVAVEAAVSPPMDYQSLLADLPCSTLALFEQGRGLSVTGMVPDEGSRNEVFDRLAAAGNGKAVDTTGLAIAPPPFCGALSGLDPHRFSVISDFVFPEDGPSFLLGQYLYFEVRPELPRGYVHVAYVAAADESVTTLLPTQTRPDASIPALGSVRVGTIPKLRQPGEEMWAIQPPVGEDMLLVIEDTQPVFSPSWPETESLDVFMSALKDRIASAGPDLKVSFKIIEIRP